jgi:hypothetical protein
MNRLLLLLPGLLAAAGCAPRVAGSQPAATTGQAPALEYRSAFEDYQALGEEKPVPWRDANEAVKGGQHHK